MTSGQEDQPPSGWYVDPVDPTRARYWGGARWTGQVRDSDAEPTAPTPPLAPSQAAPTPTPPLAPSQAAPTPPLAVSPMVNTTHSGPAAQPVENRSGTRRAFVAVLGVLVLIAAGLGVGFAIDRWILTDTPSASAPAPPPEPGEPSGVSPDVSDPSDPPVQDTEETETADTAEPVTVDVDALRPEQLLVPGVNCLDLRDAPELWERSVDGGTVVWAFQEPDPMARPDDAVWVASWLELLVATDVTGDGDEELVVHASCTTGVSGQPQVIAVYAFDGDTPQLLQVLHEGVSAAAYGDVLRGLQFEPGRINALRAEYGMDTDPETAVVEELEFRWNADTNAFASSQMGASQWWAVPAVFEVPVIDGLRVEPRDLSATQVVDGFIMPSGNIACVQTGDGSVSCVMLSLLDPQPARSADVGCARFDLVRLPPAGVARVGCDTDQSVPFTGLPTLDYGRQWSARDGAIVCFAEETGLECSNDRGHGLFLSRGLWDAW